MRALVGRLKRLRSDAGIALPIVIGIGMVMLILVATSLTVAQSGLKKTDTDQDWNGALDAAYAAVEEYQSRLAGDNSYYTYGNPAAAFSKSPISSSSVTLPTGAATNPAFGIGATGTWATVPGSTPVASFRYEVDNSHYAQNGAIRIRATGRVGNVTRSIIADLKQTGFIDYLWFVDYEVQDPQFTNLPSCKKHIWEGRSTSCTTIQYGANDAFTGPMHSNDTMTICGTQFDGSVTTSNPNSPRVVVPRGCGAATYTAGAPAFSAQLTMPPTNVELKKETRNDLTGNEVPIPGCLYTGPTVITLTADGKMNVKSPWTIKTNISETAGIASSAPSKCGTPGTGTNGLGSTGGATIDVLPSNVVYVQNVPASTSDPNYRSGTPSNFTCVGGTNPGWTFGSTQFPAVNEVAPDDATTANPAYGCRNGDVFVKGVFDGAMTIAAENYVYVTGNLSYEDEATDILGLVGNGAVWVWNPMKTSGYSVAPLLTDNGRTIQAAILSVSHTFQLQNYNLGGVSRGTLSILGSIAQTFRGTVAQGAVGYAKDYRYDERFAYMAPPKFLSPVSSSYGVTQFASVAPAFTATGATP
ncbi:hypothetical protein BH09ACT5_BH09ACT5_18690 [soil metagenome]